MTATTRSRQLQAQAEALIPGGVDSPVRSFLSVAGVPRWIARGEGAYLIDVDGNRYIDYIASWGALLFGHAHPEVVAAVRDTAACGVSFGASSPLELELAKAIRAALPAMEMLRFVNSGTEATMSAIRLARGFTGRDKFIKFAGCYHGHADLLLVDAGSGAATLGIPGSAGVPRGAVADTLSLPFNDLAAVADAFDQYPGQIAAVIVEPVVGNMGCVPPAPGFLSGLRHLTARHQALLIADEVMTGFRVAAGGACARFDLRPDLITLGKIIGGGLPVGAYGGRADIMRRVAPLGPVYQAGTLSGNPLAMAAGLASLHAIHRRPELYHSLEERGAQLEAGLVAAAAANGLTLTVQRIGSMLTLFFGVGPIRDFADANRCDTAAFARFHAAMLERGVLLPPSQFEAAFITAAHGEAEIEATIAAAAGALRASGGASPRTGRRP